MQGIVTVQVFVASVQVTTVLAAPPPLATEANPVSAVIVNARAGSLWPVHPVPVAGQAPVAAAALSHQVVRVCSVALAIVPSA